MTARPALQYVGNYRFEIINYTCSLLQYPDTQRAQAVVLTLEMGYI